jgi:hypothetical protein
MTLSGGNPWGLSNGTIVLIFFTILIGGFILALYIGGSKSGDIRLKSAYDERQKLARGKAFRATYFMLIFYLIGNQIINRLGVVWSTSGTGILIGILLSVAVFIIMCVLNDAYLSLSKKPPYFYGFFSAIGLTNLISGIRHFQNGESVMINGLFNSHCIYFVSLSLCVVVIVVFAVKNRVERKRSLTEKE